MTRRSVCLVLRGMLRQPLRFKRATRFRRTAIFSDDCLASGWEAIVRTAAQGCFTWTEVRAAKES